MAGFPALLLGLGVSSGGSRPTEYASVRADASKKTRNRGKSKQLRQHVRCPSAGLVLPLQQRIVRNTQGGKECGGSKVPSATEGVDVYKGVVHSLFEYLHGLIFH